MIAKPVAGARSMDKYSEDMQAHFRHVLYGKLWEIGPNDFHRLCEIHSTITLVKMIGDKESDHVELGMQIARNINILDGADDVNSELDMAEGGYHCGCLKRILH